MKINITERKEIELPDGYYGFQESSYMIKGDKIIKVFALGDYASIATSVNEYDALDKATPISKEAFDANFETAFEIIRGKL